MLSRRAVVREALIALVRQAGLGAREHTGGAASSQSEVVLVEAVGDISRAVALRQSDPSVGVVVLSDDSLADGGQALALIEAGCSILPPEATAHDLLYALKAAARGEIIIPPALARRLARGRAAAPQAEAMVELLSDREREILALLGAGMTNKAIAQRLYLSVRTVEGHVASLCAKLGVHSRTEAVLLALRTGLLPLFE